jgi:hypothetical protein
MTAFDRIITALREHGCDPQPWLQDQWLATCPCCGNRSLIIEPDGQIAPEDGS